MNKARAGVQWYARTIHCPGDTGGVAQSPSHPESPYARGTRSYTMSRIRGKDTSIEKAVRSYLFARGFRFRKNDKRYPGHPDIVCVCSIGSGPVEHLELVHVSGWF